MKPNHILLAYSGGLDTSAALHYLKSRYGCKVTAYCANLGQKENWDNLEYRALSAGADHFFLDDLKHTFIEDYVFPALKLNATYEGCYMLGTPLARPAIVKGLVDYAKAHAVTHLSHGCTPKGNDQIRFETAARFLAPNLKSIAPWRMWSMKSREDLLDYCHQHHIPIEHSVGDLLSHDENLVHITTEGDYLENTRNMFRWENAQWITPPEQAPNHPTTLKISFKQGTPFALNEEVMNGVNLIQSLNEIGARNGVGLQDIVENRINGIKVRGLFESPALMTLHCAHQHLEKVTLSKDMERIINLLIGEYGDIVYRGLWFSNERESIQELANRSQLFVCGDVWVELYKGSCRAVAVDSEYSLYSEKMASLHEGDAINSADAEGFLSILNISIDLETKRQNKQTFND